MGLPDRCFGGIRGSVAQINYQVLDVTTKRKEIAADTRKAQKRTGIKPCPSRGAAASLPLYYLCSSQPSPRLQQSDASSIHDMRPFRTKTYCECNRAQLVSGVVSLEKSQRESSRGSPPRRSPSEAFRKAQSKSGTMLVNRTPKENTHSHWAPHLLLPPARMMYTEFSRELCCELRSLSCPVAMMCLKDNPPHGSPERV